MLLMIDNYDSFTYNLVQAFAVLGQEVRVFRHDEINPAQVEAISPDYLVIGPGPCSPNEATGSNALIRAFAGKIPLLGVCLGHQCLGHVFGGKIVRAKKIMHGKTSPVFHQQSVIFAGISNPTEVVRYHSLVIDEQSLPPDFRLTAWAMDGEEKVVMGIEHQSLPIAGVQFHPESFLTEDGMKMLGNFLDNFKKSYKSGCNS